MNRREFMTSASTVVGGSAAGGAVIAGTSGTAAAQDEEPDWGGWLDDAPNYSDGDTVDARGQDEVTVDVGAGAQGLTFEPAAIWIDPGTTVIWEWTGEGGDHDVTAEDGEDLDSELTAEPGVHYEFTFEDDGITTYYCSPHLSVGMKGAVAVGDVDTIEVGAPGALAPNEMGVQIQEHYVGVGATLMIAISVIFSFFVLKYGESAHTKGGN